MNTFALEIYEVFILKFSKYLKKKKRNTQLGTKYGHLKKKKKTGKS